MSTSAPVIALNEATVGTHVVAFQQVLNQLRTAETSYKKTMDDMNSAWLGSSGKNFAEAAGRVEARFAANRSALEQLVYDISGVQKTLTEQDMLNAASIRSTN